MIEISACLLSYRRKYHIPEICESLMRFPQIKEIIIYQNESDFSDFVFPNATTPVHTIHNDKNTWVYGRFLAASYAKYPHIFFQDDDLVVNNIPELIDQYENLGCETIVANLADDQSSRHWSLWKSNPRPYVEIGFGSICLRESIDVLDKWPYCDGLKCRKADKIFTMMNPWSFIRAGSSDLKRLYHNGVESGRDKNSIWLRKDHKDMTDEVVKLTSKWILSRSNPNE